MSTPSASVPISSVSSPASTGAAGTFFEQHANAYWLAQLLVRGIPPIIHDCVVLEVHFQTEHLGWNTDDFLVVGETGSGSTRKLAGQVKRTFTVSSSDSECTKAIQDFWRDFKNGQQFSALTDRFALVTLRGTNTLLEHFAGLLDCARAAHDGDEFARRLATPKFISDKAIRYSTEIQTIISEVEQRSLSVAEIWPFLKVLHVLSLDLNTATQQTEAMIKTLLAHTTGEHDAVTAADASWNALLRLVGEGMPAASSFRRNDLPETLQHRHSPIGGTDQQALRGLSDHSALIMDGIRSTIGNNLHLVRASLIQEVIEQLDSTQVVLLTGAAGNGKSGVAKDAIAILSSDHFAFAFRAEEFACPHFDSTLQRNQIQTSGAKLNAILAGQGRKIMLIESVERLLEAGTRDAFTDLLTLVAKDRSWQLILTCRDYSADLVRTCFLQSSQVGHSVVTVPLLDDRELQEVEYAFPALALPLANTALRRLLRNPYILDKALQISWRESQSLPQSERDFRNLFWQEIVRADHLAAAGMPRRRENAFVQIAIRRARALSMFAPCEDLESDVIAGLRNDSLIVSFQQSSVVMAPAHDVLEDWAILHWIDEQYAIHGSSILAFSTALGTYPAIRRTYRKWVSELIMRASDHADEVFQAAIHGNELPTQFRDDTLVSLLHSPSSPSFLQRHNTELFANDKQLLRRVMHLLRVACVTTPAWMPSSPAHASLFNAPDGPAWAYILQLVQTHLESFSANDLPLLLGFIEDWARGVSWQSPYPSGSEAAAAIAYWLLPQFDDYRAEGQEKRTLQLIAKIPKTNPQQFVDLLRGDPNSERQESVVRESRSIIFNGMEGMPACRDLPDEIIAIAKDHLLCSEEELRDVRGYRSSHIIEPLFGIKETMHFDSFPPSAYRGPFLQLLRYHFRKGLNFIVHIFNHSADWYAHPRLAFQYVEPPFEMTLTFSDGTSRNQCSNARLWNLYRGTSVGPHILQTALMALEHCLLEIAESQPTSLDSILLDILRNSNSGALTSVAASVATAFPHRSSETLLVLLRSPECMLLDRQRLASECQASSRTIGSMPLIDHRWGVYNDERKKADGLPHRQHDLETAIANLQLGPFGRQVHEIIDRHHTELPPTEEQHEDHLDWRIAMHRMDLRNYTVAEDTGDALDSQLLPTDDRNYIRLNIQDPEPDVKEMMDQSSAQHQAVGSRLGLFMWGTKVFRNEEVDKYDPTQWRLKLRDAQIAIGHPRNDSVPELGQGGPGFVAAICIRDHWEEMVQEERDWCVHVFRIEIERDCDNWHHFARIQAGLEADGACARVLPLLLEKPLSEEQQLSTRRLLVIALTHALNQVRWHTAWGVGKYLWHSDRDLALHCVKALQMEAALVQERIDGFRRRSEDRFHSNSEPQPVDPPHVFENAVDAIESEIANLIRTKFFERHGITEADGPPFDPSSWVGSEANGRILAIMSQAPSEAVAIEAFAGLSRTLVSWWDAEARRHRGNQDHHLERNHQTEAAMKINLQKFLLQTSQADSISILQPILQAVERHPRETHWILLGLIEAEDSHPRTAHFWFLWKLFAEKVRTARWLANIDERHSDGNEMLSAVFLGTSWKDGVRHWRSLEGYAELLHSFFEDLPTSSLILDYYVRFLYHVGEQSLPRAFVRIARRLEYWNTQTAPLKPNTIFVLEILLQRHVYGRPLELKRDSAIKESVLKLLNVLVENGSSAAYRMRDDFVTPIQVQ